MSSAGAVVLCPGQGAQAVGMGKAWADASPAARVVFEQADRILGSSLGATLTDLCFNGPAELLNRTDASQPAIFTCSLACWAALGERGSAPALAAVAGLSLGEYTALVLAGAFDFETGLRIVALRGRLMQEAAEASKGSMVAIIGASDEDAAKVCEAALAGHPHEVLVPANYNAPGQVVLSGHASACARAVEAAGSLGFRATPLTVAGAFHSALMRPAADRLRDALARTTIQNPNTIVWSNVTGHPHKHGDAELLRDMLVQQLVQPVRWSSSCQQMAATFSSLPWLELAPGTVLRGLMRRIHREIKVESHDAP